tara:strand:+ start:147733 stop:150057 length:2325 start_codon:yes stop_codon:yes gene_type:complete
MIKIKRHTQLQILITVILSGISIFSFSSRLQAASSELISINIPAQPLNEAFIQLSQHAGIQFFYTDGKISTIFSPAIHGEMTVNDAVSLLLAETEYLFEFTNSKTIRIFAEGTESEAPPALITQQPDPETNLTQNQESQSRSRIYEIVTTSQQRLNGKNLQDIPISINVLQSSDLQARNITNIRQLNEQFPNINIRGGGVTGGSVGTFAIRGVPGVIRYLDGVAQPSNIGALINVLELESIEILKGPQGTLFGKNALGGAIRYTSSKPSSDFSSRVNIKLGNFNYRELSANVDVPISESLLTKFTAARISKDGYVESGTPGVFYGDEEDAIFRAQANWQPSTEFELNFSAAFNRSTPEYSQANVLYEVFESHPQVQAYNNAGLPLTDTSDAFGKSEQYHNSSRYLGQGNIWDEENYNLNFSWNFSPEHSLVFITGQRDFEWGNYADLDASRYAYFEQWRFTLGREKSYELQIRGVNGNLDWTAGLYHSSTRYTERQVDWKYEEIGSTPRNELTQTLSSDRAVFAETSYEINEQLSTTLGIRYSEEKFRADLFNPLEARPPWQQITNNTEAGGFITGKSDTHRTATPRYAIQYNWSEEIMTYLSYTQGFNGGGINNEIINNELIPFYGEKLKQYELGIRSDYFDNRLRFNAAYFIGNWEDIQVFEVIVPGIFTTRNAGEARIEGLDAEMIFSVTDNFRLNFSAGILDSRYINVGQANTIQLGSLLTLAPDKSFYLGGTYFWTRQNGDLIDLHIDYGWMDKHVSVSDERLQDIQSA